MPDRHRGAALRLAWARRQIARGHSTWETPSIHTWDAWLTRQWREAVQRGAAPPALLLDTSQERTLWEMALEKLAEQEEGTGLTQHAGALMSAAQRAVQSGIDVTRSAHGREQELLAAALQEVHAACRARGLLSLRLATMDALGFLEDVPAPLVVGVPRLSGLQSALAARFWPAASLLAAEDAPASAAPVLLRRAVDLEHELAACSAWCRQRVERDAGARLLVMTACTEPSLGVQAALLWRELSAGAPADEALRARWLAVEGGEPLLHQSLAADALAALELALAEEIDAAALLALLRSPYAGVATPAACTRLAQALADTGLGRWPRAGLQQALRGMAGREPAAAALEAWLTACDTTLAAQQRQPATAWAQAFTVMLDALGFARAAPLDSREQQRLDRWNELLDEFARLDAVLPSLSATAALSRLRRLAGQARHQPATGDAAVTLSASLADPLAHYDGIWVLGLAEARWPAPPRPDAWIDLVAQRRAQWPEAGVRERREQAAWALSRWQRCTGELVLSHPAHEGDIEHRASSLLDALGEWQDLPAIPIELPLGLAHDASDQQLAALQPGVQETLRGGTARLAAQQMCAFRAQAQWRLGAAPPAMLSGGVPASLRGRLLHLVLQNLWQELGDQSHLLALDAAAEEALLARCWQQAAAATRVAQWLSPPVLSRERSRTLHTVARLLELERMRPPFSVEHRELPVTWQGGGARLSMRIDRIDRVAGEGVLIDYKSGAPSRIALHVEELQPLQLAVYAAALAQQGVAVSAAALLNLSPSEPSFAGVAAREGLLPERGVQEIEDWPAAQESWQQQLAGLLVQHLSGDATLTVDRRHCARCHLPAFCRRAGADVADAGEVTGNAGAADE